MTIYVFGNENLTEDNLAIKIAKELTLENIEFAHIKENQDLPFAENADIFIMDTVVGISHPQIFSEKDLEKIKTPPRSSVHDFDLAFQLKYLKKLGKIDKFKIIGIPYSMDSELAKKEVTSLISML